VASYQESSLENLRLLREEMKYSGFLSYLNSNVLIPVVLGALIASILHQFLSELAYMSRSSLARLKRLVGNNHLNNSYFYAILGIILWPW
jgi:hypothetical protein